MDFLALLANLQSSGGILVGLVYLAWVLRGVALEVRYLRRDFSKHESVYHGVEIAPYD